MQVFKKSFFESDTLPDNPKPYTMYFIESNGNAEGYVTDRFGHVKKLGNSEMIYEVVVAVLSGMDLGGGTGRPFRETYKDQLLLNR